MAIHIFTPTFYSFRLFVFFRLFFSFTSTTVVDTFCFSTILSAHFLKRSYSTFCYSFSGS
ncbi:hypothetical protein MANES_12G098902v8 [Manihot esculenta]|uniref:Uncharacterized protein n=1 Tax=Manihot esculenta TaxID=3983 RepID=A0ACB7GQB9_MANES|nr:hypothetical protein MANES_12G098902v8 [Manihot esculenta]